MLKRLLMVGALGSLVGCGGSSPGSLNIPLQDFDLDPAEVTAIETAQNMGGASGATYTYDDATDTLTISFTESDLTCEGLPRAGDAITAEVISINATMMTLNITVVGETEGDMIDFVRVDSGDTGFVGVWETQDGSVTLYLVITADGEANLITSESCPDEPNRNSNGCFVHNRTGFSVTTDGDDSEWDAIGMAAFVEDAVGDQTSGGSGADILRMATTTSGDRLYILVEFGADVDVPAGTSIRFETRQSTGSNTQMVSADIGRNGTMWVIERTSEPSVTANFAIVGSVLEIDLPLVGTSVDLVRPNLYACGMTPGAPCEEIEAIDVCGALSAP